MKNAELLSLLGACIASGAIALWLWRWLAPFKLPLLVGGLAVHAAAMVYRNRLEKRAGNALTRWEHWLYRGCWLILAILAVYLLIAGVANGSTGVQDRAPLAGGVARIETVPLSRAP